MKALSLVLIFGIVALFLIAGCTSQTAEEKSGSEVEKNTSEEVEDETTGEETDETEEEEESTEEDSETEDVEDGAEEQEEETTEQEEFEPLEIPEEIVNNCVGFLVGSAEEAENINLIGAGWARPHPGPFAWGDIETSPGVYDFSSTDYTVKLAQEHEISILGTIWPFAKWDQEGDSSCKVSTQDIFYPKGPGDGIPEYRCKPKDMEAYKNFLKKLVERYDGDGIEDMPGLEMPVLYWEILNEPEMQSNELTFFKGTEEEYVEILEVSYTTIKESCPKCKVVQGGAAGVQEEFLSFWENVFDLGGGAYFDIANIHCIGCEDSDLNVGEFKEVLDKYELNKPIWVTEVEFVNSNAQVLEMSENALNSGASKLFFVSFNVGGHSYSGIGEYDERYETVVDSCLEVQEESSEDSSEELTYSVKKDSGVRIKGGIPYAYKLENGKTRLYYCDGGIVSAISDDGLNFEKESGVRISEGCDPTIVETTDGKLRMYYKIQSGSGGPGEAIHKIYSAISEDGLAFEEEGLRIDSETSGDGGWASVPDAIKLPDGRIRLYYVSNDPEAEGGLVSAISSDGLHFTREGVILKGNFVDPAITILPDGRYWLLVAHNCVPEKGSCSPESGLYSYISEDGLTFENQQLVYASDSFIDPAVLEIGENEYRVYYWSMKPPGEETEIVSLVVEIE